MQLKYRTPTLLKPLPPHLCNSPPIIVERSPPITYNLEPLHYSRIVLKAWTTCIVTLLHIPQIQVCMHCFWLCNTWSVCKFVQTLIV